MSDLEQKLRDGFDRWFEELKKLLPSEPKQTEGWAVRWFDGFTPEEAAQAGPEDE